LLWCRSWNLFVLACISYLLIPRYAQYTIVWNTVLSNTVYSIVHPPSKHKSLPGKKTEGKTSIPFCGYSACILLIESDPLEGKGNCRLYGATERNLLIQTGTLNTCATVVTMVNCYLSGNATASSLNFSTGRLNSSPPAGICQGPRQMLGSRRYSCQTRGYTVELHHTYHRTQDNNPLIRNSTGTALLVFSLVHRKQPVLGPEGLARSSLGHE